MKLSCYIFEGSNLNIQDIFESDSSGNDPLYYGVPLPSYPSINEYQEENYSGSNLDQTSSTWLNLYQLKKEIIKFHEMYREILTIINHSLPPKVEIYIKENLSSVLEIRHGLNLIVPYLNSFFQAINTIKEEDSFSSSIEEIKPIYDLEIWDDPDFEDKPTPVIIITLPIGLEYDIFSIWKKIDDLIYQYIDPEKLITSLREK